MNILKIFKTKDKAQMNTKEMSGGISMGININII